MDARLHERDPSSGLRLFHCERDDKDLRDNVVLTAIDEVLKSQGLAPTPVAYLGALMMSLQADNGRWSGCTIYASLLRLLESILSVEQVPRSVLIAKFPHVAAALIGAVNMHTEHLPVLRGAFSCALRP